MQVLERFRGFGGIRIEDDMIITKVSKNHNTH
jgi:Xaa-Pro aminopeptidase